MDLNPIPLSEALPIVADVLGLRLPEQKEVATGYLNRIRSLWYHGFQSQRLFDDLLECVPTTELCLDCSGSAGETYTGLSLPSHMAGPVSAWISKQPLTLRSRWWEKHEGVDTQGQRLELVELNGNFAAPKDPLKQFQLRALATSPGDSGKEILISGNDCEGRKHSVTLKLDSKGWVQCNDIWLRSITSVSLPSPREGEVILAALHEDESTTEIDTYRPTDRAMPRYRRFRVTTPCGCNQSVLIQANRRFNKIWLDQDVVEIGEDLILEHGARHFKNAENTTDKEELARGDYDLGRMHQLIKGMILREKGGQDQDGNLFIRGSRTRKARLKRHRR